MRRSANCNLSPLCHLTSLQPVIFATACHSLQNSDSKPLGKRAGSQVGKRLSARIFFLCYGCCYLSSDVDPRRRLCCRIHGGDRACPQPPPAGPLFPPRCRLDAPPLPPSLPPRLPCLYHRPRRGATAPAHCAPGLRRRRLPLPRRTPPPARFRPHCPAASHPTAAPQRSASRHRHHCTTGCPQPLSHPNSHP